MFSAVDCLLLPNNAAGQLLLMQKVKSHKAKSQNSVAADLIGGAHLTSVAASEISSAENER